MNLEALREDWKALDAKVELGLRVSLAQLRRAVAAESRPSQWRQAASVIADALVLLWLGGFAYDERGALRFALPAVALWALVAAHLGATVREQVAWRALDLGAPLVTTQRALTQIRQLRIRVTQGVFMTAGLVWALSVVVIARALGVDLYATPLRAWLLTNVAFGVALVPMAWGAMRWLARRLEARGWLQPLLDDIAGKTLVETEARLAELAAFERDAAS